MNKVNIRPGTEQDAPQVLGLIKELATFEKAAHEVTITIEQLIEDGFRNRPVYEIVVAETDEGIVGIAVWYTRYSTWKGRVLYLEDIVVREELRGQGIGKLLFEQTMRAAQQGNFTGMRWQVLDWNESAINFYKKYRAEMDDEWINGSLSLNQINQILS